MNRNFNKSAAFEAKTQELHHKDGHRSGYMRSLVLIFIIVVIAATVSDLRRPNIDKAQAAFTDLVYQQMDAQKDDFWLGGMTAQELLAQEGWITGVDSDPDVRRTAAELLDVPHTSFSNALLVDWDMLKIEEAARLWTTWQEQPEGQNELDFINGQLALAQQNKTLPGLGEALWMLNDVYLLAVDGDTVGICRLSDLKHLD